MKVVVASRNPVKIGAAQRAFGALFPDAEFEIVAIDVPSGVRDQPVGDDETRSGARARTENARAQEPDADYWVGMEGGIDTIDGVLTAFAWMVVLDRRDRLGMARSVSLPLPAAVKALVDDGMELGTANDRVFDTVNSKQKGGAFGLLTDGRYTRQGVYAQTMTIALNALVNPLYEE